VTSVIPTADLSAARRGELRALLDAAFAGNFGDDDWDHALGGLHVIVEQHGALVAHAAVVQRSFVHEGRAWRCGYVEAVAVHPVRRGQGFAAAVMDAAESVLDRAYDLGALSTSENGRGLYVARGWLPWLGRTAVLAPTGPTFTPEDDDSTYVRFVPGGPVLDREATLSCDWRNGDVW
jgi:aminoglycoside 2'-N-acetyltransferase I